MSIRLTALTVVFALTAWTADAALPAAMEKVRKTSRLPVSAISLMVQGLDDAKPVAALNASTSRNPASAIKVATTWTALDLLGPTHYWPTSVYALGPIKNGVLHGDLLIKGGGDPFLVIEDFWKLLGQLKSQGVRDIRGNLIIDESLFSPSQTGPGAFDGRPHRLYNVAPAALLLNFKSIRFIFNPDGATGKVKVHTEPRLANLTITSRIKTNKRRCRGNAPQVSMTYAQPDNPDHIVFTGALPRTCVNYGLTRTAMSPRSYAYGLFKSLWAQWGGTVTGTVRSGLAPKKTKPLFVWRSRPLADSLRPLNKWSNNAMSRSLLLSIGASGKKGPVSRTDGVQAMVRHLKSRGLDTSVLKVDNGAGLSRDVRASAKFFVDLLRLAWQQATMPEFISSLSIAGRDGTTRRRYARAKHAGRMHLKTGQLDDVIAVTGYVHARSGKRFAIALLVNHPGAHRGPGQKIRDAFLKWTFSL